MKNKMKIA